MARVSRPPGFDMTYRPERRRTFGPPISEQLPALVYLAGALVLVALIVYGQNAPHSSALFEYVVEGDRDRVMPSSVFAIVLFVSALSAVLRERMRGVVVHPGGVEMRELAPLGWPKLRRFAWSQIDKLRLPTREALAAGKHRSIGLELWDGSSAFLPRVARPEDLARILEKVALARAIPLEGGGLLDDLEGAGEAEAA